MKCQHYLCLLMSLAPMDRSNTTTMPDLQKLSGGFRFNFGNGELLFAHHGLRVHMDAGDQTVQQHFNLRSFIPAITVQFSLCQPFTNLPDHSHVLPKNICFVWSGTISALSRPLMDAEIIWCADSSPVSQPRRQSALFLTVFSAAMICGCVAKTNGTNYSML